MSPTHPTPGYIPGMQRPMTPHDILQSKEQLSTTPQAATSRPMNPTNHPTHGRHGSGNGSISSLSEVLHNPNFNLNPTTSSSKPDVNKTVTRKVGSPALPKSPYVEGQRSCAQGYSPGDEESTGNHEMTPSVVSRKDPVSLLPFPRMSRSPTPNESAPAMKITVATANHRERVGERKKSPSFPLDQPNTTNTLTEKPTKMGKHQKHESGTSFVLSFEHSTRTPVLTSFPNPSHSSFGSEGSSYHSIGEEDRKKDRVGALFAKTEGKPPEWYDFTDFGIDTARAPGSPEEVSFKGLMEEEEVVKQLSGLSRDDFVAVQQRLLNAVQLRVGRGVRDKIFPYRPPPTMPGSRLFTGQLSSSNSTTSDDDETTDWVLAKARSLFGSPTPPTAKRNVEGDQILGPTQGLEPSFRKPIGTTKTKPFPIGEDSLRDSSRRPVTPSLLVPPLQLLSWFLGFTSIDECFPFGPQRTYQDTSVFPRVALRVGFFA